MKKLKKIESDLKSKENSLKSMSSQLANIIVEAGITNDEDIQNYLEGLSTEDFNYISQNISNLVEKKAYDNKKFAFFSDQNDFALKEFKEKIKSSKDEQPIDDSEKDSKKELQTQIKQLIFEISELRKEIRQQREEIKNLKEKIEELPNVINGASIFAIIISLLGIITAASTFIASVADANDNLNTENSTALIGSVAGLVASIIIFALACASRSFCKKPKKNKNDGTSGQEAPEQEARILKI